jgi:kynurenine formamidase
MDRSERTVMRYTAVLVTLSCLAGSQLPIHVELLRNQGMMIGELCKLDGLAAACPKDGVYEFLFVAVPLNLTNATASPLNPQAIK